MAVDKCDPCATAVNDCNFKQKTIQLLCDIKVLLGNGNTPLVESCCCQNWVETLCYLAAPPQSQNLVFRENNIDVDGNEGYYIPYTWFPDAVYTGGSVVAIPCLVHGATNFNAGGNGTFNSTYTHFYTFIDSGYSGFTAFNYLVDTDYINPLIPSEGSPIAMYWRGKTLDVSMKSICIDPTTDILYGLLEASSSNGYLVFGTILTTDPGLTTIDQTIDVKRKVLGFSQSGQGYLFDTDGNTFLIDKLTGTVTGPTWSLVGESGEYVYSFMGYAGGAYYGVATLADDNVYRNRLINIVNGDILDTIVGEKRGNFYQPTQPPVIITPFTRTFEIDCKGILTTTDRDLITGELIVIPQGVVVETCT